MKLGSTQRALLEQASSKDHGLVSFCTGYYTGRRAPAYGSRNYNAAVWLAFHGLLERHSSVKGVHHFIGNTSADHYTEHTFKITEAGRKTIADLLSI